jgi:hypothetical protein
VAEPAHAGRRPSAAGLMPTGSPSIEKNMALVGAGLAARRRAAAFPSPADSSTAKDNAPFQAQTNTHLPGVPFH